MSVHAERRVAGLSEAVLSGRLRERGSAARRTVPFAPTYFDAELLAAADAAVASHLPLGVVLPFPGAVTPLLLGAAAVVGAVIERHALDVQIAVVSPNLRSRTLYDQLWVKEQRLADFIPRTRIDPDGVVHVMGRPAHDAGGRLHLTGDLTRVAALLPRLNGLVIDAGAVTERELTQILNATWVHLPLLYLTADPGDAGLQVLRDSGGVVWGWDAACLGPLADSAVPPRASDAGPIAADPAMLRAAAQSIVTIRCPQGETEIDEALADLWTALGALSGVYRSAAAADARRDAAEATRWAWGVYNSLALLPVAPGRFDAYVGANPYVLRLGQADVAARAFARNVTGEARQAWYVVADALATALAAAGRLEKLTALIEWVADRTTNARQTLLVVRNAAAAAALAAALNESPHTPADWPVHVHVITLADFAAGRLPDGIEEICLPGTLPRSRAGLLALPHAREVTVITAGSKEARRAARQGIAARALLADVRAETVEYSAPVLGVTIKCTATTPDPADSVRVDEHGVIRAVTTSDLGADAHVWEPFDADVVAMLRDTVAAGDGRHDLAGVPPVRVIAGEASVFVPVIALHLADGTEGAVLLAEPNDLLTRRRRGTVERVAAKSLTVGDVIVLVDRSARQDLLDSVTVKLSESPAYAALASLVDFWHERARRVLLTGMTYREILGRMQPGTAITTEATIGNWVRGSVDGPRDHDDLLRFAIAVHDPELRRRADEVGWALRTLHGIHIKIGLWLAAQVSGAVLSDTDTVIDPALNIHVADLLEAVSTHRVTGVDNSAQTARASELGVVLTPDEARRALRPARVSQ
jgi:hypothetical protein